MTLQDIIESIEELSADIPQVDEMNIECGWGKLRARIEIAP
ncbi:MAG: hypothetical protein WBA43_24470 [Elainellaceae cyanobacterium]